MKRRLLVIFLIFCCACPAIAATAAEQAKRDVSMNFDNVDLKFIVRFMSELTGKNFVIGAELKGRATVVSREGLSVEEAYRAFESILAVNGYAAVPSGDVVKIVPLAAAKQSAVETSAGRSLPEGAPEAIVTRIIVLKFAGADNLKEMLAPFISSAGNVSAYAPTNTLIITESASNVERLLKIVDEIDSKAPARGTRMTVFRLENSLSANVAGVLGSMFTEQAKARQKMGQVVGEELPVAVADKATNSVIVTCSEADCETISGVIKDLDRPRQQVLVEALIAETGLAKATQIGIELAAAGGIVYGPGGALEQNLPGANTVTRILGGGNISGISAGVVDGTREIAGVTVPKIGGLIAMFQRDSDIDILSAPQIIARDNEQAKILVGENRAFIRNLQVTAEGGTVRNFEFKDVGLELEITPHVNNSGEITLEVRQKVEDLLGTFVEGGVETSKREAVTTITVRNESTVMIGGLIRDKKTKVLEKVPVLGDIPLFGALFRKKKDESQKTNLLIFISPRILPVLGVRDDPDYQAQE